VLSKRAGIEPYVSISTLLDAIEKIVGMYLKHIM
jgi:hypothetical protein